MERRLTVAFTEFLARNRGAVGRTNYYGVRVSEATDDGSAFALALTFRSGERYCCAEPLCHLGLHDPRVWRIIREILGRHGLAEIPPMTVLKLRGVVEMGAILGDKANVSDGYTYEVGPYFERNV
jgi:hypothetical protein